MSAFVLNDGGFGLGVLIRTCLPSFAAGVNFDEESLGRVFVPKKQGLIQRHRFDSVKRYVVIGSRKPLLGKSVPGSHCLGNVAVYVTCHTAFRNTG